MEKRLKPQSINKYNTALRFFYETTLSKTFNLKAIPRCRAAAELPVLLTREELWRLFDVCELKDKAIFMTFYGSGIRLAELTNLKVSDIDSKNMQIFVRQGKHKRIAGRYCLGLTLKSCGNTGRNTDQKNGCLRVSPVNGYSTRAIQLMLQRNLKKAGIDKHATIHTLRHCFATHLMEDGVDASHIKKLMGHASIASTAVYVHMTNLNTLNVTSPLDKIGGLSNGCKV